MQCSFKYFPTFSELLRSKIFLPLLSHKTFEEVIAGLGALSSYECQKFVENEVEYRSELKSKFVWLEIQEKRVQELISQMDYPGFLNLSKILKKGKVHLLRATN